VIHPAHHLHQIGVINVVHLHQAADVVLPVHLHPVHGNVRNVKNQNAAVIHLVHLLHHVHHPQIIS